MPLLQRMTTGVVAGVTLAVISSSGTAAQAASSDTTARRITKNVTGVAAKEITDTTRVRGVTVSPAHSRGREVTTLLQRRSDGYALIAVLERGQSTVRFPTPATEGQKLVPSAGGFVILSGGSGPDASVVGEVDPPWAVDANGRQLETSYVLNADQTLTQLVDTREARFPVVADPRVRIGWYRGPVVRSHYYWSETWRMYRIGEAYGQDSRDGAMAACALVPIPGVGRAACAWLLAVTWTRVWRQVKYAIEHHRCLAIRFPLIPMQSILMKIYTTRCIR